MPIPSELAEAYRRTRYLVDLDGVTIDLRLGERTAMLDLWLTGIGQRRYAIITAYNARSRQQAAAVNEKNQNELMRQCRGFGLPMCSGRNVAFAADWPDEPTCLIAGLDQAQARRLGKRFGQCAVVIGELGGAPRLLWITEEA